MKSLPIYICSLLILLASCSTTEHLPEGETLYVGIDKISYSDAPQKKKKAKNDSTGVITSIGNAVIAIDKALEGKASLDETTEELKQPMAKLTREEQRALDDMEREEQKNFASTQTEVEAVLAYAPNNSLFGSSYHRIPFPVGLWFYNGFVDSKTKMGKWIYRTFAATPVCISNVSLETRARVATSTLHNFAYFRGRAA